MSTQIVFNVDTKLKKRAMQQARSLGIPLSAFLKIALQKFASGSLTLDVSAPLLPNAETQKLLAESDKDIEAGKNMSPAFDSSDEAISYLKKNISKNAG